MKKDLEDRCAKFNYLVLSYDVYDGVDKNSETESIIGDTHYLVEDNSPATTGIDVFTDIPEREDDETGEWVPMFADVEEYWNHLTELHVSEATGEFREDARGELWYYVDGSGWFTVSTDGELSRDPLFETPDEADADDDN